ncbi:hypothetical protein ANO11243_034050 [Dothideomycetidae sp. 11243]|nr:hypothetical protein ANO11243_034050 [fungal sp. No.11243]
MQIPSYNALPLTHFFLLTRLLSMISTGTILSITAYFTSVLLSASLLPPSDLLYALSVVRRPPSPFPLLTNNQKTSISTLYLLLSIPFFLAPAHTGLLIMALLDALLALCFAAVSILFARPLSQISCAALPRLDSAAQTQAWLVALAQNVENRLGVVQWAGQERGTCFATKVVWGVAMGLW